MAGGGMSGRLFVFGLGYTGIALARSLIAEGWTAAGTSRDGDKLERLRGEGVATYRFARDLPLEEPATALAGATHLVTSIAPDEAGDPVLDRHLQDLLGVGSLVWAGYLGTTGVYGDRGGAWVHEAYPPAPTSDRTRRRVRAEGRWLASGLPAHVFRLAGIYGPGRSALDSVRSGRARRIVKPGQMFGRIHVDDIVATLRASMARPNPGAIYNVADDEPAPPQDVVAHAASLLGIEPPPAEPFGDADLSPMARSFYADNRRVSNERIREELGVELRHPTYREGLRDILRSGG
jgi:nucleoside-diphosphate-sugar epimerase